MKRNVLDGIDIESEVRNLCSRNNIKISTKGNGLKPYELDLHYCPECIHHQIDINVSNDKGGQWKCYKCGTSGNFITLYDSLEGTGAFRRNFLKDDTQYEDIDLKQLAKTFHTKLKSNEKVLSYFKEKRLYDEKTINYFGLGFSDHTTVINKQLYYKNCVAFPIFNKDRTQVLNIRFKQVKGITPDKYFQGNIYNTTGYGNVRTCYINYIENPEKIWIVEGEPDGILVYQMLRMYYPNLLEKTMIVSSTAGTKSIPPEWTEEFFKDIETTIFYDCDEAGKEGALKVNQIAKNSKIANLRNILVNENDNDITDLATQIGLKRTIDYLFLLEKLATSENNNLLLKSEFNKFKQDINKNISHLINSIGISKDLDKINETIEAIAQKVDENSKKIKEIYSTKEQLISILSENSINKKEG